MPERPDLRQISGNIREALADYDRDALLAVLTYVFKEYVVEGPPPMLVNQAERIEDFEDTSFAQLIGALQTRFDHPELSLFQVDGNAVSVRVQGVMQPLSGAAVGNRRGAPVSVATAPAPAAQAPAAPPAPRQPGVSVVEATLTRRPRNAGERVSVTDAQSRGRIDLAGGAAARGEAPRARRGLSVGSARPTSAGGTMMPTEERATAPSTNQAASTPAPAEAPPKDDSGDDASIRFSLLEFD